MAPAPTKTVDGRIAVPQSREEADALIARYRELDVQITTDQATADAAMRELRGGLEADTAPRRAEMERIANAVQSYCEAHRGTLTEGGKRGYTDFTAGRAGWRKGSLVVEVDPDKEPEVAAQLRKMRLSHCVSIISKLDKPALKKIPPEKVARIDGLRIVQAAESFYIKPHKVVADRSGEGRAP